MKTTAERIAAITARRNTEVIETVVHEETKVETTVKKPRKPRVKKQPEA